MGSDPGLGALIGGVHANIKTSIQKQWQLYVVGQKVK